MLVKDLIEYLQKLPQDAEIRMSLGIGKYYLIVSSSNNIQTSYIDD